MDEGETPGGDGYGGTPTPGKTPGETPGGLKRAKTTAIVEQHKVGDDLPKHQWNAKVARFVAYCTDGGLLCSQFTIAMLIAMLTNVEVVEDEKKITDELQYMLHIRKIGTEYKRDAKMTMERQIKEMMNNEQGTRVFSYNAKVLVILIECGYIQEILNPMSKADYPRFLIALLSQSDRNFVKESVCRMIIKYFGKKKSSDGVESAGPSSG